MTKGPPYMLDTNIFNRVLDQKTPTSLFANNRVIATWIQAAELRQTPNEERRTSLLSVFTDIIPQPSPASSFVFDIDGAGLDQANWSKGPKRFQDMLAMLHMLDHKKKKRRKQTPDKIRHNQTRDVLIAETAINNGAILISDDRNLRRMTSESGGRAITLEEFQLSRTGDGG
jgi:predicted nucleic acid-binding protein